MFPLLIAAICTFVPPSGWEIAHLKKASPYLQVGFIRKGSTYFRPSFSLAIEEVEVSLKEYVKAVKELHKDAPQTKWRDLGAFHAPAGAGRLIEISSRSNWGEIKTVQAIFLQENKAYILTAAVLKEEWPRFQAEILQALHSTTFLPDLWAAIEDPQKKEQLQRFFATLGQSDDPNREKQRLQKEIDSFSSLGAHWQFLALREGLAKIGANK